MLPNFPKILENWMPVRMLPTFRKLPENYQRIIIIFLGCIIEEGTDYKDEPIKSEKQESQQDCADLSSSTPEGVFWTWNKNNKKCFVKKAKGKLVKVDHAVGGNRECGKKFAKNTFSGTQQIIS